MAQFVVQDINNLPDIICSGLRLFERQSDAACRKTIAGKMQEAVTRSVWFRRQLLDAARPCYANTPSPNGGVFHAVKLATAALVVAGANTWKLVQRGSS